MALFLRIDNLHISCSGRKRILKGFTFNISANKQLNITELRWIIFICTTFRQINNLMLRNWNELFLHYIVDRCRHYFKTTKQKVWASLNQIKAATITKYFYIRRSHIIKSVLAKKIQSLKPISKHIFPSTWFILFFYQIGRV